MYNKRPNFQYTHYINQGKQHQLGGRAPTGSDSQ